MCISGAVYIGALCILGAVYTGAVYIEGTVYFGGTSTLGTQCKLEAHCTLETVYIYSSVHWRAVEIVQRRHSVHRKAVETVHWRHSVHWRDSVLWGHSVYIRGGGGGSHYTAGGKGITGMGLMQANISFIDCLLARSIE